MALDQSTSTSTSRRRTNFSVFGGILGGIGAAATTFVLFFVVKMSTIADVFNGIGGRGTFGTVAPDNLEMISWTFFEAHNVGTTASATGAGVSRSVAVPLRETPLWDAWFLLVPPLVLLGVGYFVASSTVSWDAVSGFQAGASIAFGYCVLAALAALTLTASVTEESVTVTVGPDLVPALIIAGIVYPVVFGGIGGAIAGRS